MKVFRMMLQAGLYFLAMLGYAETWWEAEWNARQAASTATGAGVGQDEVRGRFNLPLEILEQEIERREHIWGDEHDKPDADQIGTRYAQACPVEVKQKVLALKPYTRQNLELVRSWFYLGEAGKRLDLCRRTSEWVAREGGDVAWAADPIKALDQRIQVAMAAGVPDGVALFGDVFRLRRRILFAHPALQFEKLLINKNPPTTYSHNCDQYLGRHSRIGQGPVILTGWKEDKPREQVLLKDRLPPGAYYRPNLHPDGTRFLFAYADHSTNAPNLFRFFIYEAATDGSWVRQVTGTPRDELRTMEGRQTVMIEDGDPCYLPDGGIVFVSTRSQNFGRCHNGRYTPALMLYRCDKDGGAMRPLSYGIENETTPSVLNDGRILYTRWEYVDRHEMEFHKLWWKRPDGTGVSGYYGNDTIYPLMISEAQPIPGSSKVMATAMGHHSFHTGTTILIDVTKGDNGPLPITRLTPEVPFPESNEAGWPEGQYATPYPLTETLFFATYSPDRIPSQGVLPKSTGYMVVLVDGAGGREPIYRDPATCCFSPTPVAPRRMPPLLPSLLPETVEGETGVYTIQDVSRTRNDPKGMLKPGQIKALRFIRLYVKPAAERAPVSKHVTVELPKKILGTVPVGEDGSVVVRLPAGVPLQIEALDANGMAILTERSFHYLHAGEQRGCIGCHAESSSTPPKDARLTARTPVDLVPPAGPAYPGGFSFARTVQPVLDRYCIRCHGLGGGPTNVAPNLVGEHQDFPASYKALVPFTNPIGSKGDTHGLERNLSRPMDYYAHGSRLGKLLLANHKSVNLPRDDFQRLVDWLDLNALSAGDCSFNRAEYSQIDKAREVELRQAIRTRFGEDLAKQPFAALVNCAQPDESRILMAPLPVTSGGWGQIPNGWKSKEDLDYQHFYSLVLATILSPPPDVAGTCGHDKHCLCNCCWVRKMKVNQPPLAATPIKMPAKMGAN